MPYNYYYYDGQVDSAEVDYDSIFEENQPIYEWRNTYETCIIPSTLQILWYMSILIGWSFINRVGLAVFVRLQIRHEWILHTVSILPGSCILYITAGLNSLIIAFIAGLSYVMFLLLNRFAFCRKNMGIIMLAFTISVHLGSEVIWKRQLAWQVIKGSIMVANMKIISVAFEIAETALKSQQNITVPNVFSFLGYIFMPSTLIIGPWVPFSAYLHSIHQSPSISHYRWVVWCLLCSVLSLSFINLSNCIVPLIFSSQSPVWMRIFRDALAVRCSHYFVSFLSQASIASSGISLDKESKANAWLGHMITKPLNVEFPRSLNTVVRSWNIPMHIFLKEYIFRGVYKRFHSQLLAIFITYFVSSLLHGEYLKIYLVLLSLASFGYIEYKIRLKIASAFNACVAANICRNPCHYKYCPSHGWTSDGAVIVQLVNISFSILTIFHLAYLGAMMSDPTEEEDAPEITGYYDYLKAWSIVSYSNHWIALFTYVLFLAI
ncbi:protein-serine O-palmitoleoyltransferase porcupine [Rhagoletis pomonella]|uniref:protein-serine O-palmitoleoyltransferase porcupine n=1 Tax=Rhagoletis pomonella TaxID=28610 RepID=UPI0017822FA0|nr:protein-serine O-palmitoleoyltransferase porcupine [Rhagoletis pomonella]